MEELLWFLKRAIKFILILPLFWFVFIIIWGSLVPEKFRKNLVYEPVTGFTNLRLTEADRMSPVQLLIVGSSHVYRGVDTRRFEEVGIKAFNLGSSLQTPLQTEYLLHKYLDKMNPKIVLFEVGYKTFSSDGVEGALDLIINSKRLDGEMVKMACKLNDITVYNTLAFTFFRKNILGETRQEFLANQTDHEKYISGGFVERLDSAYVGPKSFDKITKRLSAVQEESFNNCLKLLKRRNVKVVLIQTPILQDYYSSIDNMSDFNSYFNRYSKGYQYYNFNNDIYKETKYFYDHHHLNSIGVHKFNDSLIKAIRHDLDLLSVK
jgi:hypothetical protein